MKRHTKIYFDYFGYDVTSFIPCEICGTKAVDINHIKPRGMGGSKKMDNSENLMAVCRECHIEYGDKKQHIDFLTQIHKDKCNLR
jgi:ribosome-binding protein aMBF1 (putative translation factor)